MAGNRGRLKSRIFARHSNPWSAWSRLLSAPLISVALWRRSGTQGVVLALWMLINPVVFPEPPDDGAFSTRAILGERMWIEDRPMDAAMALNGAAAVAATVAAVGAWRRMPRTTVLANAAELALILGYWRRMSDYYMSRRARDGAGSGG